MVVMEPRGRGMAMVSSIFVGMFSFDRFARRPRMSELRYVPRFRLAALSPTSYLRLFAATSAEMKINNAGVSNNNDRRRVTKGLVVTGQRQEEGQGSSSAAAASSTRTLGTIPMAGEAQPPPEFAHR